VEGDSIDAEVTQAPPGAEAMGDLNLTALEMTLGGMCDPPHGEQLGPRPKFDWVVSTADKNKAMLRQVPNDPTKPNWSCETQLELSDGFSGTRKGVFTLPMPGGPAVDTYELTVKRK
jgi:hypothetical protein